MITIPKGYSSSLNIRQTQVAIKKVKDFFERDIAIQLNLTRVSAPLFVAKESGLNDNLNGFERPVGFDINGVNGEYEIVQSLAKWKRLALSRYGFAVGEGLYTDMNAIRRDEVTDNIHSVFVDQWDWEKVIDADSRSETTLRRAVKQIYSSLKHTVKANATSYKTHYMAVGRSTPLNPGTGIENVAEDAAGPSVEDRATVRLYDVSGKLVLTATRRQLESHALPPGVYVMECAGRSVKYYRK